MLKKDEGQGSAECNAFESSMETSNEQIVAREYDSGKEFLTSFKLRLFRHYTNNNIYMIRKRLTI